MKANYLALVNLSLLMSIPAMVWDVPLSANRCADEKSPRSCAEVSWLSNSTPALLSSIESPLKHLMIIHDLTLKDHFVNLMTLGMK